MVSLGDLPKAIPAATVARLPVYLRVLERVGSGGSRTISSDLLAEMAGTTAAIVRKDLSALGSLGTRGAGYGVDVLRKRIEGLLGADRCWPVAIVGVGNLGRALANYPGLAGPSFELAALFDVDCRTVGTVVAGVEVSPLDAMEKVLASRSVSIAVITTPASSAEEVASRLVGAGIRSILNFAPVRLAQHPGVVVRDVDVGMELLVLSFNELLRS